ncbi:MAG: DUF5675 family protein [Bacteroidota bacterium]
MAKHLIYSTQSPDAGNLHYYHLPKGWLHVQLVEQTIQGESKVSLRLTEKTLPDPAQLYFLQYESNYTSQDTLSVQFQPQGYLKSISTHKEYPKNEEGLGDFAGGGAMPSFPDQTARSIGPAPQKNFGFGTERSLLETLIDPFDAETLEELNKALESLAPGTKISFEGKTHFQALGQSKGAEGEKKPGIFCRQVVAFPITTSVNNVASQKIIHLPHPERTHFIEVPAISGTDNKLDIQFDDLGFPTAINLEKGSQAEAILTSPLRVIRSIFGVINEVFQLRIDLRDKATSALEKKLEYTQAQADVEKKQLEIKAEQEALRAQYAEEEKQRKEAELQVSQAQVLALADEKAFVEERSFPDTDELKQYDMQLQVIRYSSGTQSTLGMLLDVTDGRKFLAYTLEDEFREAKEHGKTRIPAGTYEIKLRKEGGFHSRYSKKAGIKSIHKGMLHVTNVENFKFILIHIGNDDDDTEGCLLVADSAVQNIDQEGRITNSTKAYKRVYPPIANALEEGKTVGIQYIDYDKTS